MTGEIRLLTLDELLHVARRTLGAVDVRDIGLLESAVARPHTTVFGDDAYPTLHLKAAAMLHSVVRNHALVDGNKRLGFAGLIAVLGLNGERLAIDNDAAYDLIIAVATGELDDVALIAEALDQSTEPATFER